MSAFWFEEEPHTFSGFREIADQLNVPDVEKSLPRVFEVNTPWGTVEELTIISVDHDEMMDEGDFIAECSLGEKQCAIRIWWNEEAEDAMVESSVGLDEGLVNFSEQWDILPVIEREVTGAVEAYEFNELGSEPAYDLATMLRVGDPNEELELIIVVYGEKAAELVRSDFVSAQEITGRDANGSELSKFILPVMSSSDFYDLFEVLQRINARAEISCDVAILYRESKAE
jgi:hypothetical protein